MIIFISKNVPLFINLNQVGDKGTLLTQRLRFLRNNLEAMYDNLCKFHLFQFKRRHEGQGSVFSFELGRLKPTICHRTVTNEVDSVSLYTS